MEIEDLTNDNNADKQQPKFWKENGSLQKQVKFHSMFALYHLFIYLCHFFTGSIGKDDGFLDFSDKYSEDDLDVKRPPKPKPCTHYSHSVRDKIIIVQEGYAEKNKLWETAQKYNVPHQLIKYWKIICWHWSQERLESTLRQRQHIMVEAWKFLI